MKYKCLIADDNILERDMLAMYLSKIEQVELVAICSDGLGASRVLAEEEIDIVLSDIDMPHLSGLGLLKSLKQSPVFIFISSHTEYAAESFELDVVDFIVKPLTFERLIRSVNKAIDYIDLKKMSDQKKQGKELIPGFDDQLLKLDDKDNYFFIRESPDLVKVRFEDVAYIESMGNFSKIFTMSDKKHITLVSLKNLESQLPPGIFMRIHKQYIINFHHISSISPDDLNINDLYRVPLGSSYRQALLDKVVSKKIVTRFTD